jgi:hypothetical protein
MNLPPRSMNSDSLFIISVAKFHAPKYTTSTSESIPFEFLIGICDPGVNFHIFSGVVSIT